MIPNVSVARAPMARTLRTSIMPIIYLLRQSAHESPSAIVVRHDVANGIHDRRKRYAAYAAIDGRGRVAKRRASGAGRTTLSLARAGCSAAVSEDTHGRRQICGDSTPRMCDSARTTARANQKTEATIA